MNLKVSTRLALGFSGVLSLLVLIAVIAWYQIRVLKQDIDFIVNDLFPNTITATAIINHVNEVARVVRDVLLLEGEPADMARERARLPELSRAITAQINQLTASVRTADGIERIEAMKQARERYVNAVQHILDLVDAGDRAAAHTYFAAEFLKVGDAYLKAIQSLIDNRVAQVNEVGSIAMRVAVWSQSLTAILAVLSLALGLGVGFWTSRSVLHQLGGETAEALAQVRAVAAGDLSAEIVLRPGDTTSLLASLREMQQTLKQLVEEIGAVVQAAGRGDFSRRIALDRKQGFGKEVGGYLNQLNEITECGLNDINRVAKALAAGDLSQTISRDYPGLFGESKEGINATVQALIGVVTEIHGLVDAANRGDFGQRLDLAGKQGFSRDIVELLNQLLDTTETGLKDFLRVAQSLAQGDLTQTISRDYPGLFGETKERVNATVANLRELVERIRESVDAIKTAASEIASGNQDLSQRTEEQASSLEEISSTMQELTSTVKQNADHARQANQLAMATAEFAVKGGAVVESSVQTMAAIAESSKKIADIIGVIDSIAFQTNILALNAAVEAARAGEQGRGFAVVAGEVRSLARRSANAAKEIKALIADSTIKVEHGAAQINEAGRRMTEIVESINRVTTLMSEIAAASLEQASGIEQVNQAILQMDEFTQQNAALVEQAAAAAESLDEQAQALVEQVAVFKLTAAEQTRAVAPSGQRPIVHNAGRTGQLCSLPASDGNEWADF
ncbi:chemotaxis protein [Caldichromatium japonicum]|uniref:Chemotaxis protein n=1 Tax=Caldichromatium japonicum TaxID=2699430 RepID=A0A6G7VDA9_9GAMM|nr:methyl-accepting chemotaxis protein [Caldichromatium japonicum]QIK37890.1 chemotaxis protein [Caldichromatium japonicum]